MITIQNNCVSFVSELLSGPLKKHFSSHSFNHIKDVINLYNISQEMTDLIGLNYMKYVIFDV